MFKYVLSVPVYQCELTADGTQFPGTTERHMSESSLLGQQAPNILTTRFRSDEEFVNRPERMLRDDHCRPLTPGYLT